MTEQNARLQQLVEAKQKEYAVWKQRKDEEERQKKEMEVRRKREEEEARKQKEMELEGKGSSTLTLLLPCFSVQIKHDICKNMNSLQQQREQYH